jgi:hypothetical protein
MIPFPALTATFYFLRARAREPLEDRELAPAPVGAGQRTSTTARSSNSELKMALRRRKTDWPAQHDSIMQRRWEAFVAWITRLHTGAKG